MHNISIFLVISILLLGCKREEVKVYQVPKESTPVSMPHSHAPEWNVTGNTPTNWESRPPSGMRIAQFVVKGRDGAQGEVAVMPMAGLKASKEEILAIWRQQFGPDVKEKSEKVKIGNFEGELYDFSTDQPAGTEMIQRILVAMLLKDNVNWFFRISGSKDLIEESKKDFLAYLNSIKIERSGSGALPEIPKNPGQTQSPVTPPHQIQQSETTTPMPIELQVPDNWKQLPPTPMAPLRYEVSTDSATALITVTRLDGDGGGTLPNINRWRSQIKLPPISQSDLDKQVTRVKTMSSEAVIVDYTGTNTLNEPARMIGIIVPVKNHTWFFKMTGNDRAVQAHKDELIKYVQTLKFL